MNKFFSFTAGAICGVLIGATVIVLFTPVSGEELLTNLKNRWEEALEEGQKAMEARQQELETQFEMLKRG